MSAQPKQMSPSAEGEGEPDKRLRLEDVRLKIGETVQLQSTAERDPPRQYVKLIGYAKGRSFIVTTPIQDGGYLLVRDGMGYVVRMFAGKNIYAFSASVIRSANTPYPHLHLTYPDEVVARVVRGAERVDVRLIASVDNGSGRPVPATVENLSSSGGGLHSRSQLGAVGAELKLGFKLELDGISRVLSIAAVIRIAQPSVTTEGEWLTGVEFREIEAEPRLLLSGYIYRALAESVG